ncbi:Lipid phosphate phosphohydrolase 1 [Paragonimus heterotremus]|uniref:Lipid phosphate phosphohydrolase 1 n=1 Tax=Paragonimus heterotremus TaxID=100268 RepID=A0A8J4WJT4_9TREM|nr:Lipid phosphate phosphohydrolase 1 [Paragonimus heterotremus]
MIRRLSWMSRLTIQVTLDLLIILLLHSSYFIIKMLRHKQLGLHFNDDTIKLPFKVDTISTLGVGLYSYSLPVLTVITVELIIAVSRRLATNKTNEWRQAFFFMYNFVVTFFIAAGVSLLLTMLIKYTFGRLRPHFLDVCQPDVLPSTTELYVDSYTCRGTNKKAMSNAFLSFLSAQASSSAVGVTYAVLYLQQRVHLKIAPLVRPLIQTIYICSCFYVVFTRFTDFKHHTTDLIGGLILGFLCALAFFLRYHTDTTNDTLTQSEHTEPVFTTQTMQANIEV